MFTDEFARDMLELMPLVPGRETSFLMIYEFKCAEASRSFLNRLVVAVGNDPNALFVNKAALNAVAAEISLFPEPPDPAAAAEYNYDK